MSIKIFRIASCSSTGNNPFFENPLFSIIAFAKFVKKYMEIKN